MEFLSEWVSWSNFFYMIGLGVAGYAASVTANNRNMVIQFGEFIKAIDEGMKDMKLTEKEKDRIMKEALDVAKGFVQSKWKLW